MHKTQQQRFMALLDNEYDRLERFALSLTRNRSDAKELIAETISQCLLRFETIEHDAAFLSYLFSVASRCFYKQKLRRERERAHDPQSLQELYAGGLSVEDSYDLNLLYEAIDTLPESYREIFIMAELHEFSHKEIQEIKGISIANIKVRVFRSKQLLRKQLGVLMERERKSTSIEP